MVHIQPVALSPKNIKRESSQDYSGHPTMCSREILHKSMEDHPGQGHSGQVVLGMIKRGRLVLVIGCQESQASSRRLSGLSPFRSDSSLDSPAEAGLCE
jgi:hypothetical protein